jgi:hypothetical protein
MLFGAFRDAPISSGRRLHQPVGSSFLGQKFFGSEVNHVEILVSHRPREIEACKPES